LGTAEWIAIVTVLVTLGALIVPWLAFRQDESFNSPNLSIEQVILSAKKDVRHTEKSNIQDKIRDRPQPVLSPKGDATIEITLKNSGQTATLINKAVVEVEKIEFLGSCGGEGPLYSTYEFDISIPPADTPLVIEHKLAFEVRAASFDQLALTVGPTVMGEGEYPPLFLLNVTLETSTGKSETTPSVAILSPVSKIPQITADLALNREDSAECKRENLRRLERITESANQVSPDPKQELANDRTTLR